MNREIKQLQKESDKHYKEIEKFLDKHIDKNNVSRDKIVIDFFKNLNGYLEAELELERYVGQ
jgi:hypothetical protein